MEQPEAYWLEGDGFVVGQTHGLLFQGDNNVTVLAAPGISVADALAGRVDIVGRRIDGAAGAPTLVVGQQFPVLGAAFIGIERAWTATLNFPAGGCWRLQVAIGPHYLEAVVYVYPQPQGAGQGRLYALAFGDGSSGMTYTM